MLRLRPGSGGLQVADSSTIARRIASANCAVVSGDRSAHAIRNSSPPKRPNRSSLLKCLCTTPATSLRAISPASCLRYACCRQRNQSVFELPMKQPQACAGLDSDCCDRKEPQVLELKVGTAGEP